MQRHSHAHFPMGIIGFDANALGELHAVPVHSYIKYQANFVTILVITVTTESATLFLIIIVSMLDVIYRKIFCTNLQLFDGKIQNLDESKMEEEANNVTEISTTTTSTLHSY